MHHVYLVSRLILIAFAIGGHSLIVEFKSANALDLRDEIHSLSASIGQ